MPWESASDDETADELGEGWSVMVLDDDAGFPAGYWLTDTGPGHRRVRGCGSNSLPGPWDFSSWLFGAGDVPDIEGWARVLEWPSIVVCAHFRAFYALSGLPIPEAP